MATQHLPWWPLAFPPWCHYSQYVYFARRAVLIRRAYKRAPTHNSARHVIIPSQQEQSQPCTATRTQSHLHQRGTSFIPSELLLNPTSQSHQKDSTLAFPLTPYQPDSQHQSMASSSTPRLTGPEVYTSRGLSAYTFLNTLPLQSFIYLFTAKCTLSFTIHLTLTLPVLPFILFMLPISFIA